MGLPARGYTRTHPPYEPGNRVAQRHGVWSTRRAQDVAEQVDELAEQVAEEYPWTRAYPDERRAYARALVDERDIQRYIDQVGGPLDEDGNERPAVRTLHRFSTIAASRRAALGLSPVAHARLLVLVAEVVRLHPERGGALEGSLDQLLAEGRAALDAGAHQAEEQP